MANFLQGGFSAKYPGKLKNARRYEIASGYNTNLFPGDACTLVTAGTVQVAVAGAGNLILGIVAAITYVDANNLRVYGGYWPANTTYSPTARGSKNSAYAWVWDDPDTEWTAQVAADASSNTPALAYAAVGATMGLQANAGDVVYRRSNHQLDGVAAATAGQFRILEIIRDPVNDLTSVNYRVNCQVDQGSHVFETAAGI
jgi:hypothetical protein